MAHVNKPTDPKQKEADINRKLQLYGIFSAFQEGKAPSNEQIDVALNSFLQSQALSRPSERLSAEGKALVADVREVVELAKQLVLSKNEGNLLQDFIYQTSRFDYQSVNTPNAPVSKDTAKQHGDNALEGLRTLGTLLITNGQFRKLLNDATVLLRDMAGDAASNAAGSLRPDQEKLNQIDAPADDNTWHDVPDFSKENMKNQFSSVYKGDPQQDARDVANAGVEGAQPGRSNNVRDANPNAGAVNAGTTAARKLDEKIPDEKKDQVKETAKMTAEQARIKTKNYLSQKMPQERREQTIWRLKKMVLECQQHPDYEQAIETLLDLAEEYGGHAKNLTGGGAGTVQETRSGLAAAEADLKTLIERFANGTSTNDLWGSIDQIYKDADADPELNRWFKNVDTYIRKCLKQQGYIMEDASTDEWNRLYDQGNFLLREKYRGHTDRVIDEIKFLADQFDKDPLNTRFGRAVQKLFLDLGNDENGKPTFKPHLLKDLTEVIVPLTLESIAYIPIPRIEYSDPQIDAIIENLCLESDNFMPNVLEVASDNYWRFGRKNIANQNKNAVDIKVTGIQMDMREVSFYIKRKQGFPSITDTGVANILMGGDGFCFRIRLSTADGKDKQHFFKVDKVDVDVTHLSVKMIKSKHKLLFSMFQGIALKAMRPAIQKAAEKAIKDQFTQLDEMFYQVKLEADRALEEVQDDPENAPNVYNRYASAFQKKVLQGKKKAEDMTADKKVNVAITKEDSIFPNIHLPGGISSKATEYKQMARTGERWESPVFSIGSAQKSTNIPKAPEVVRKPHDVADLTHDRTLDQSNVGGTGANSNTGYNTSGYNTTGTSGYNTTGTGGYNTTGTSGYNTTGTSGYNTAGTGGYNTTGTSGYNTTGTSGYNTTGNNVTNVHPAVNGAKVNI